MVARLHDVTVIFPNLHLRPWEMILGRKRESLDGDGKKGSQVRSDWEFGDGNRNAFASREREYTEATEKSYTWL